MGLVLLGRRGLGFPIFTYVEKLWTWAGACLDLRQDTVFAKK